MWLFTWRAYYSSKYHSYKNFSYFIPGVWWECAESNFPKYWVFCATRIWLSWLHYASELCLAKCAWLASVMYNRLLLVCHIKKKRWEEGGTKRSPFIRIFTCRWNPPSWICPLLEIKTQLSSCLSLQQRDCRSLNHFSVLNYISLTCGPQRFQCFRY